MSFSIRDQQWKNLYRDVAGAYVMMIVSVVSEEYQDAFFFIFKDKEMMTARSTIHPMI